LPLPPAAHTVVRGAVCVPLLLRTSIALQLPACCSVISTRPDSGNDKFEDSVDPRLLMSPGLVAALS